MDTDFLQSLVSCFISNRIRGIDDNVVREKLNKLWNISDLVICLYRICNEYTLLQRKYVEIYKDEEESAFEQVAKVRFFSWKNQLNYKLQEHAAQVADANVRLFFDERKENDDWDWVKSILLYNSNQFPLQISGVPAIRNKFFETLQLAKEDNSPNNLFTPLQLWAKHKVDRGYLLHIST